MPIFIGLFFRSCNDGLGAVDGRPPDTQVARDFVAGLAWGGPLSFRHSGGMTDGSMTLPFAGVPPLQRLNGPFECDDFARQEIFADKILVSFTACRLKQIHDGHRNLSPAERPAGLEPPLSGNQPTLLGYDNRMQQSNFSYAVGKRAQVSQVFAVTEADLDLINIHARGSRSVPISSNLHRVRNPTR
jgi:hypothetical protein